MTRQRMGLKDLSASHPEKLQTLSDLLDGWEAEMSKTAAPFPQRETQSEKAPPGEKTKRK